MTTAFASLEGASLDEAAFKAVIKAAKQLATLQGSLEPMGGVISWFTGRSDLGTFGTNIEIFAKAMGSLKTEMGEDGISTDVVTSVTNAGNALMALQEALPEEGWFDGKMNLDTFGWYIETFALAMGTFAEEASTLDPSAINTAMSTAYRIKTLIETLSGLDASGLKDFAGVGLGSGDGHLVNMGQAIGKYAEEVAGLNVDAVTTSVSAAVGIRNLISSLVGLDTSGIENFKIGSIGTAMKNYAENVSMLDPTVVLTSVTAAERLRNFIVSLSGIDISGVSNFNPKPIGSAIQSYSATVSSMDSGIVYDSISAAIRLRNFITSLSGFDSSGVSKFKSAIEELSKIGIDGIISNFAGKADAVASAMGTLVDAMANGLTNGGDIVSGALRNVIIGADSAADNESGTFTDTGRYLGNALSSGLEAARDSVKRAGKSLATNAKDGARSGYSGMYSAGEYMGKGAVSGLLSQSDEAYDAGAEIAKQMKKGFDEEGGIKSPSRVMMREGRFMGEGAVIGIESMGGAIYRAGSGLAKDAIAGVSKSISRISDAINSDIDAQPTIRPVLDLSDVRAGASSIGSLLDANPALMANIGTINTMMNRRSQNGANSEVVSAITKLRRDIANMPRESYNINGVTYDDGSNIKSFAQAVVHQARIERRV